MQPQVLKLSGKRLAVGGKTVFRNSIAVIGGHTYKTVRIGNQEWLAENFKYDDGGEGIYTETEDIFAGEKYYLWTAAVRVSTNLPDGWHLPSKSEYETLLEAAGGANIAGLTLKSTSEWDADGNGTDNFGFNLLPTGYGTMSMGVITGIFAYLWTSTEYDADNTHARNIRFPYNSDTAMFGFDEKEKFVMSVRLVRNVNYMTTIGSNRYRTVTIGDQEWLAENLREDDGSQYVHTFDGEKYYEHYRGSNAYTLQLNATLADGWHLPSNAEYSTLYTYVGGASTAGQMLKSESGWDNNNGLNKYGFNALPYDNEVHYIAGGGGVPSYHVDHKPVRGGFAFFATSTVTNYRNNYTAMLASGNNANIGENANEPAYSRYMNVRLVRPAINYTFIGDRMYKTVKIGSQIWLAENLRLNDGGAGIYTGQSAPYANEHFYTWEAAVRVAGTVGNGWRLPSKNESDALVTYAGGSNNAGKKLKSKDGWDTHESITNTDEYRFTAIPTGRREETGAFTYKGQYATFWTATEYDPDEYPDLAYLMYMQYDKNVAGHTDQPKAWAVSVRLVKDA